LAKSFVFEKKDLPTADESNNNNNNDDEDDVDMDSGSTATTTARPSGKGVKRKQADGKDSADDSAFIVRISAKATDPCPLGRCLKLDAAAGRENMKMMKRCIVSDDRSSQSHL